MITVNQLQTLLICSQGVAALCVLLGGVILLLTAVDGMSRMRKRWPLIGMCLWAVWMLWAAGAGHHDSPAAIAMTALVAFVLLRYGRQVRGILDGEAWWPPNAAGAGFELSVYMRPRRARLVWWRKLNPWWLLFGNDDDGYFGDPDWNPPRLPGVWLAWVREQIHFTGKVVNLPALRFGFVEASVKWRPWRAVIWWLRNPCHNLTWYVIGVADRERMHRGRWAPDIHKPGGGWLIAVTDVYAFGLVVRLPFVSYLSPWVKAYAGWRPSGAFGFKFNLSPAGSFPMEG